MDLSPKRIEVVAGLIFHGNKILVCQRHKNGPFPLKWEFPGGKIKGGESAGDALGRELREELGIVLREARPVFHTEHAYPGGPAVSLNFYLVVAHEGVVENLVFQRIDWVELGKLDQLDFLDGDRPLLARLVAGGTAADFLT